MFKFYYESQCSSVLKSHVDALPIWNRETKNQHIDAYRTFETARGHYSRLEITPRKILDENTLRRLQVLVDHAFTTIPHYRELYRKAGYELGAIRSLEDFSGLPIIQKGDLRIIHDQVVSDPNTEICFTARTSGSTGVPLSLINDPERTRHWFVTRLHMFEHMMGTSLRATDWIYNIYIEPFWLGSIFGRYRTFSIGLNADLDELAAHIRQMKPKVITGIASRLLAVMDRLPDAASLGIQVCTTNSETSSMFERRSLAKKLGVAVLDEYSSEELGIIAWESRNSGDYLVAEDTVYLELEKNERSGLHQTIGTDLWNFTMPRIRYNQNDHAEWVSDTHDALIGPRRIAHISGREDMLLISPQYGPIEPSRIMQIFDTTLVPADSGVEEFRLVQESPSQIKLLVRLANGSYSPQTLSRFRVQFEALFGTKHQFEVEILDKLPPIGTKRRCIVRKFDA